MSKKGYKPMRKLSENYKPIKAFAYRIHTNSEF